MNEDVSPLMMMFFHGIMLVFIRGGTGGQVSTIKVVGLLGPKNLPMLP